MPSYRATDGVTSWYKLEYTGEVEFYEYCERTFKPTIKVVI